jgi:NADPH:quinone reductase
LYWRHLRLRLAWMRALVPDRPGGPQTLSLRELEPPPLALGQVRVATCAVGLNLADSAQIAGEFPHPSPDPAIPGFEAAGRIIDTAGDVGDLHKGQRVLLLTCFGAYAEQVVVPADRVFAVPDGMDDLVAAGFPVAYATAYVSLIHRGGLQAGETVAISGASGKVGRAAVEVAHAAGAHVIALQRPGSHPPRAGAAIMDPGDEQLTQQLREAGGGGLDMALDLVGGSLSSACLAALRPEGRLVSVGFASGEIPDLSLASVLLADATIVGQDLAHYILEDFGVARTALERCLRLYAEGRLEPPTPESVAFHLAADGVQRLLDGTAKLTLALDLAI